MASCKIGNLSIDSTVFFLCDMQEYSRGKIAYFPAITNVANRMVKAAHHLGIPVIATEHKGYGNTVPEIDIASINCKPFIKTTFSMVGCDGVIEELKKMKHVKSVVIFGVMADVCIYDTTLELLQRDYEVHVMSDGVSSNHNCERMISLERLRHSGAIVSLSKITLCNLIKSTDHPKHDVIAELVDDAPPDGGLVNAYG